MNIDTIAAFIAGAAFGILVLAACTYPESERLRHRARNAVRAAREARQERDFWREEAQPVATVTRIDRHIGDAQRVVRGEFKP